MTAPSTTNPVVSVAHGNNAGLITHIAPLSEIERLTTAEVEG